MLCLCAPRLQLSHKIQLQYQVLDLRKNSLSSEQTFWASLALCFAYPDVCAARTTTGKQLEP